MKLIKKLNKLIDFDCLHGVIESGSNANGNWVKFGDGTMICYGYIVGNQFNCSQSAGSGRYYYTDTNNSRENVKTWTYPQAFKTGTAPIVNTNVQSSAYSMTSLGTVTATSANAYCVLPYPVTSIRFYWEFIAIGRWK